MQDLVGYRDENVIPVAAFYRGEVRRNHFATLCMDSSTAVRRRFFAMVASWLWALPDHYDHESRLMPYLLSALHDDDPEVCDHAHATLVRIGARHEEEHRDKLLDRLQHGVDGDPVRVDYDRPLPAPLSRWGRPALGQRLWVRSHVKRFLTPLLTELADWHAPNPSSRHRAACLLAACLVFLEEHATAEAHRVAASLVRLAGGLDLEHDFVTLAALAGRFIDPDALLPALLPMLPGTGADAAVAVARHGRTRFSAPQAAEAGSATSSAHAAPAAALAGAPSESAALARVLWSLAITLAAAKPSRVLVQTPFLLRTLSDRTLVDVVVSALSAEAHALATAPAVVLSLPSSVELAAPDGAPVGITLDPPALLGIVLDTLDALISDVDSFTLVTRPTTSSPQTSASHLIELLSPGPAAAWIALSRAGPHGPSESLALRWSQACHASLAPLVGRRLGPALSGAVYAERGRLPDLEETTQALLDAVVSVRSMARVVEGLRSAVTRAVDSDYPRVVASWWHAGRGLHAPGARSGLFAAVDTMTQDMVSSIRAPSSSAACIMRDGERALSSVLGASTPRLLADRVGRLSSTGTERTARFSAMLPDWAATCALVSAACVGDVIAESLPSLVDLGAYAVGANCGTLRFVALMTPLVGAAPRIRDEALAHECVHRVLLGSSVDAAQPIAASWQRGPVERELWCTLLDRLPGSHACACLATPGVVPQLARWMVDHSTPQTHRERLVAALRRAAARWSDGDSLARAIADAE